MENTNGIKNVSDVDIIREAGKRLVERHKKRTGENFLYGYFQFVFHDGNLVDVEEFMRTKLFKERNRPNMLRVAEV